jgi:copper transport protein
LVRSEPPDGTVLATAPANARFFFDDDVRVASGIKAIRNGDGSMLAGKPRVVGGRVLVVPLRSGLGDGDYTVLWRVLSDDGHTLSGVTAFGVGVGRAPPTAALSADNGPSAQDVVSRLLFFAGLLTAAGAAFFRFAVGPVPVRLLLWSFLLVFVGASGVLHDVSLSTRFGTVMAVASVVAAVGGLLAAIAPVYPQLEPLPFVTALVLLPAPSLAGHALDRGRAWFEVVADLLHVAAASVWLGGLVALALALRGGGDRIATLRRFSNVAVVSVAVLAATGIVRALSELDTVSQLWSTGYGRVLVVKSALLAVLVGIGWLNRYRLIPRVSFDGLRRSVAAELLLFAGLVAAVALLTDLRPGRDRQAAAAVPAAKGGPPPLPANRMVVQAQEDGELAVALALHPPGAEVTALDGDGNGVNGLDVTIAGARTRSCGDGCYGAFLSPRGSAIVSVDGRKLRFRVPANARPAGALVARATRAFRALRSVDYVERLASSPRHRVVSDFTLERPNRLEYRIRGGASGIIIGGRRWDRARGGKWVESPQFPLPQPEPTWGAGAVSNAYLLETTPTTYVVSFLNPAGPAWFTLRLDRRTLLPRTMQMTAQAHFMKHRYLRFNAPPRIKAPGGAR